jgi:radical SAM C-methyltransferase
MRTANKRHRVWLVQQGVWDAPMESMPLAAGYLKATAMADRRISESMEIAIFNYRGGLTVSAMANDMFRNGAPDVLAFSVLGWNFRAFGVLAATFKQINPGGVVIFGGTHVANQSERTFSMFPEVDIVVNGEGELAFVDLLHAYLDGRSARELEQVHGISFTDATGRVATTPARERLENLDVIPSPFLTGAIPMLDENGVFRYDVAIMETNRGCPYRCSFCYWGGAVGQRVRAFSRQRLRAELEFMAQHKVHTIVLCDANFGMLPIDAEFVEDLLAVREHYGYPRALETSWAKNKSKVFYKIVQDMKNAGLRSSFTLSLQTLSNDALSRMNRRNMKINDWLDLIEWLEGEGLECYAEIIWGAPGETVESFLAGYDRLSEHVSRIAMYPLLLLPNTEYLENRDQYGFITVKGDTDDFDYVLAHDTMTFEENQAMRRFVFWARVINENLVLRHIWTPIRIAGGLTQSSVLRNFADWIDTQSDADSAPLREVAERATAEFGAVGPALVFLYCDQNAETVLNRWWRESIRVLLPERVRDCLDAVFAYDLLTRPVSAEPGTDAAAEFELVEVDGEPYFRAAPIKLQYDVPTLVAKLKAGEPYDMAPTPIETRIYYKVGFAAFAATTNHEQTAYFIGRMEHEVIHDIKIT